MKTGSFLYKILSYIKNRRHAKLECCSTRITTCACKMYHFHF